MISIIKLCLKLKSCYKLYSIYCELITYYCHLLPHQTVHRNPSKRTINLLTTMWNRESKLGAIWLNEISITNIFDLICKCFLLGYSFSECCPWFSITLHTIYLHSHRKKKFCVQKIFDFPNTCSYFVLSKTLSYYCYNLEINQLSYFLDCYRIKFSLYSLYNFLLI